MADALEAPEKKFMQVHVYENGHFISSDYKEDAVVPSAVLPGFSIELKSLWTAAADVAPLA